MRYGRIIEADKTDIATPQVGVTEFIDINDGNIYQINAAGEVVQVETPTVLTASGVLTVAQILDINSTPVELIPAPGAGKYIEVVSINEIRNNVQQASASTAYATVDAGGITAEYAGGATAFSILATLLTTDAPKYQHTFLPVTAIAATENVALVATMGAADPVNGDFDIVYSFSYKIVTVPV